MKKNIYWRVIIILIKSSLLRKYDFVTGGEDWYIEEFVGNGSTIID
jgi:hypothetical protein